MTKPIKELKKGDYTLKIFHDSDPESPREWGNQTKMLCFHNKYNLGDEEKEYDKDNFDSFEHMEIQIRADKNHVLPLYLFDHSGITISTGEFDCKWDSGQVGFIYISKEEVKNKKQAEEMMQVDVKIYDQFLTGEVYGYRLEKTDPCKTCGNDEPEELDSCWGFYGFDDLYNQLGSEINWKEVV